MSKSIVLPREIEEAAAIVKRLQDSGKDIELPAPPKTGDPKELIRHSVDVVVACQSNINKNYAIQGFHLLHLKQNSQHGELQLAYEKAGLTPRSAQLRMKVAKMLLLLPERKAKPISHLTFQRQLKIARLPEGRIDELAESGELEKLAELPEKEFSALVEARKREAKAKQQLEHYQSQERQRAEDEKYRKVALHGMPEILSQAREFAGMLGQLSMELSIRGQILFDRSRDYRELHADKKIAHNQASQAAKAQLLAVEASLQHLLELREHILDTAGDEVRATELPELSPIELQDSEDLFRKMLRSVGTVPEHIGEAAAKNKRKGRK